MSQLELAVIVPSRGRPHNVARLLDAWDRTRRLSTVDAELWVIADWDDPARDAYDGLLDRPGRPWFNIYQPAPIRRPIGPLINELSRNLAYRAPRIGFMGDDHLPRTGCWDGAIVDALDSLGSGIAYGNDLLQGERLPTAAFMTSDIIRTLGYMSPPTLEHLYIDDAWAALGRAMGRLRYLPDVIIEHLHPDVGKAERDQTYDEANAPDRNDRDKAAFEIWRRDELPRDLERLRTAGVC
jgi:hypothetical protein